MLLLPLVRKAPTPGHRVAAGRVVVLVALSPPTFPRLREEVGPHGRIEDAHDHHRGDAPRDGDAATGGDELLRRLHRHDVGGDDHDEQDQEPLDAGDPHHGVADRDFGHRGVSEAGEVNHRPAEEGDDEAPQEGEQRQRHQHHDAVDGHAHELVDGRGALALAADAGGVQQHFDDRSHFVLLLHRAGESDLFLPGLNRHRVMSIQPWQTTRTAVH